MALPGGYQQVAYIESSGTQYIDTGIVPGSADFSVLMDIQSLAAASASNWFYNIGTDYTGVRACYVQFGTRDSYFQFHIPDVAFFGTAAATTDRVSITTTFAGTAISMSGDAVCSATYDPWIASGGYRDLKLRICQNRWRTWLCEVYSGGTMVGRFVPAVRRSDGAVGMYDEVGGAFHGNAGTGAFTAGPVVGPVGSRALLEGTAYEITGGSAMVDGTVYAIAGGKTLVDGTVYDIPFDDGMATITITGFLNNFEYCGALRIDGTNYLSETTLELPVGTVIHCCTREWDFGGTHLNGTKVSSLVHAPIDVYFYGQYYAFVVEGDAAIRLQNPCNIYITT